VELLEADVVKGMSKVEVRRKGLFIAFVASNVQTGHRLIMVFFFTGAKLIFADVDTSQVCQLYRGTDVH
jgi:hypothetical protein